MSLTYSGPLRVNDHTAEKDLNYAARCNYARATVAAPSLYGGIECARIIVDARSRAQESDVAKTASRPRESVF